MRHQSMMPEELRVTHQHAIHAQPRCPAARKPYGKLPMRRVHKLRSRVSLLKPQPYRQQLVPLALRSEFKHVFFRSPGAKLTRITAPPHHGSGK